MDILSLQRVSKAIEVIIAHFTSAIIRERLKVLYNVPAECIGGISASVKSLEDLHCCERTAELAHVLTEGPQRLISSWDHRKNPVPNHRITRSEDSVSLGIFHYSLCLLILSVDGPARRTNVIT